MSAAAPVVRYFNGPDGFAHATATVKRMADLAKEGAHTLPVRQAATRITRDVPSKQCKAELAALYRWVRDNVRYRKDPVDCEWVQSPAVTLAELAGDCDDMGTLLSSLAQSIGYPVRYRTVGPSAGVQKHVSVEALCEGDWVSLDPVLEPPATSTRPRAELGAFGRRGPGAAHIFTDGGAMLSGMNGTRRSNGLWPATPLERQPALATNGPAVYRPHSVFGPTGAPTPAPSGLWPTTPLERQPALASVGPIAYRPRCAFGPTGAVIPMPRATWRNSYDPTDLSGATLGAAKKHDVSGAARWHWIGGQAKAHGKKNDDVKAMNAWWAGASPAWRQDARVNFLAVTLHAPKGLSRDAQTKWWQSIGKAKRQQLRDRYDGTSFFEDVLNAPGEVAKVIKPITDVVDKVVQVAAPIVEKIPIWGTIAAQGMRDTVATMRDPKKLVMPPSIADAIVIKNGKVSFKVPTVAELASKAQQGIKASGVKLPPLPSIPKLPAGVKLPSGAKLVATSGNVASVLNTAAREAKLVKPAAQVKKMKPVAKRAGVALPKAATPKTKAVAMTTTKTATAGDAALNAIKAQLQAAFDAQRTANAAQVKQLQAMVAELQAAGGKLLKQAQRGGWPAGAKQVWDTERNRWTVYAPNGATLSGVSLNWSLSGVETDNAVAAVAAVEQFIQKNGKPPAIAVKAVRTFQSSVPGLVVDGLWGNNSRKAAAYHTGRSFDSMPAVAKAWAGKPATWEPPAATKPAPAPAPKPATVKPAPKPPTASKPKPVTVTPAKPKPPASPSVRTLASDAVAAVRAFIKQNGKPPAIAVKAVRTYQTAKDAYLKADGLWGPKTRAQAAADLGVAESTLPTSAYEPKASKPATKPPASTKPKPPTATKPKPVTVTPAKPKPPVAAPSRRELAADAVAAVRAFIKSKGKPPAVAVKAVRAYQGATAGALKADGLWGPKTRAQAAADLGVAESTLPASAYEPNASKPTTAKPKPSAPAKPKPAAKKPTSSPAPSGPVQMEPVWSGEKDPNLPVLGPGPSTPSSAGGGKSTDDRTKSFATLALVYYFVRRRKAA